MVATESTVLSGSDTEKAVCYISNRHSSQNSRQPMVQDSLIFDPFIDLNNAYTSYEQVNHFYSESVFKEMIAIETKRIYRNKNAFLLVLIDVSSVISKIGRTSSVGKMLRSTELDSLIKALHQSTRKIDLKGWYKQNSVIGILCIDSDKSRHKSIMDKIRASLVQSINAQLAAEITIRWKSFPCDDPVNDQTRVICLGEFLDDDPRNRRAVSSSKKMEYALKRGIDILGSLAGITLFSPFFVLIALLVKFTSKGPILFKQKRVGFDGKTFTFLKFRSMYMNNDESIHKEFISKHINGEVKAKLGDEKSAYKMKDDPRITKVGKILRKTSLDEIPQFLNVLKGDMSLVGPRPPIPYEVEKYDRWHTLRVLNVKPGITGFWQVEGRSSTTFDAMVRMDLQYVRNWSVWLDIKLIFKTPIAMFMAKGAC